MLIIGNHQLNQHIKAVDTSRTSGVFFGAVPKRCLSRPENREAMSILSEAGSFKTTSDVQQHEYNIANKRSDVQHLSEVFI
jgi:hypothetical protein